MTGASLDDRNEALDNLRTILLMGGPVALLLASLAGYIVAGRALRPVEAMRRRAAAISAAEPEQRLPLPEAHDELHRLGETLNEMLGRLEVALERERAFVDDASHELRTPLALHKTELELALRYARTPEEMRAAIASAIEEVDRLIAARRGPARPGTLGGGQAGAAPPSRAASPSCSATCGSDSPPGSTARGARSWSSRPTA